MRRKKKHRDLTQNKIPLSFEDAVEGLLSVKPKTKATKKGKPKK